MNLMSCILDFPFDQEREERAYAPLTMSMRNPKSCFLVDLGHVRKNEGLEKRPHKVHIFNRMAMDGLKNHNITLKLLQEHY